MFTEIEIQLKDYPEQVRTAFIDDETGKIYVHISLADFLKVQKACEYLEKEGGKIPAIKSRTGETYIEIDFLQVISPLNGGTYELIKEYFRAYSDIADLEESKGVH